MKSKQGNYNCISIGLRVVAVHLLITFVLVSVWELQVQSPQADTLPREEHPRPQFKRSSWKNLNGTWEFAFDFGKSGVEREWFKKGDPFNKKITVPFPPESKLSGIQYEDFMPSVWYRREFDVPDEWSGKRIFVHFGAVDYESNVWINGEKAGRHVGGSSSFSFEITDHLAGRLREIFRHR